MSKKTAAAIIASGNDYLISLKGNSRGLYPQVAEFIATNRATRCCSELQRSHGRQDERSVKIWRLSVEARHWLPEAWQSVGTIISLERVRRTTSRSGRVRKTTATQLYVTSHQHKSAEALGALVRGHWSIENCLHWVKDVIQQEDGNRISTAGGAVVVSILKTIVLNLMRSNGYTSIKHATIALANKIPHLYEMIART